MNISLTEDLKSFVDLRVKARGYSSYSEYMRDLVRKDEEQAKVDRLRSLLQEGLESGPGRPWPDLKTDLLARGQAKREAQEAKRKPA